jgi:hypothetical protein
MKLKIFSHAMDFASGRDITLEQSELLEKTGLLDAADELNMMLHFNEQNFDWIKERWKNRSNVKYHVFDYSYREWYEATTMNYIQKLVHSTDEEFYVLCITHKGISHGPGGHQNWRKYMQYFTIEKWKECVAKLDEGYDTCGSPFLNNPPYPFYAGTFFWAKASYLRRCKKLLTPQESNFTPQFEGQPHHRFDLECWNGSGNPKWFDLNPGPENRWYASPEHYRDDMKNIWIYRT